MAASIRSIRDALDVRLGPLDGKVSHFERETIALGRRGLAKVISLRRVVSIAKLLLARMCSAMKSSHSLIACDRISRGIFR